MPSPYTAPMAGKTNWLIWGTVALCCIIYLITTIIAGVCISEKKNTCAATSGIVAGTFGALLCSGIVCVMYSSKHSSGSMYN